jgi:hypothetical protein
VPGDEMATNEQVNDSVGSAGPSAISPGPAIVWPDAPGVRSMARRLPASAPRWLSIFGVCLGLFLIRFLVPVPVGQSDNRDGPRLMCGMGVGPVVPHGDPRFFRYIYFQYAPSPSCSGHVPYPSSEVVPLAVTRLLTPLFGLPGTLNLIALGVLMCVLASAGIASLATGLRMRLRAQLVLAAACWLIIADAAFFDVFASPFSEPAALVGLLLVAAGVVYLGRGWRDTVLGLALAGSGGFLAILSKEQYLVLAAPVCATVVLASATWGQGRGLQRLRTRPAGAAVAVAALLATLAAGYALWDYVTPSGQRLHHIQAVDMIFTDIVTQRATAPAQLRALGLPASWAKYAGHYYWDTGSVRDDPLYHRYAPKLTDGNIGRYLVSHPGTVFSVGQQAAVLAQQFRVTTLGDYPPTAGYPPTTLDTRVSVVTWLVHRLPSGLGLLWLIPLWAAMAAVAIAALTRPRGRPWHRDGAVLVLCMTGCAMVAFIPPAYFAGISTTRHMVGMNLATALAFVVSTALVVSMTRPAVPRPRRRPQTAAAPAIPELARENS